METGAGLIFNIQKYSIHDGPGIRTTVFLKGCPLCCQWCSNPESQNPRPQLLGDGADSRPYSLEEALRICLQDKQFYEESGGGVTLSGGEPLTQPQFVFALLAALKAEGIHTAIETSGCVRRDIFAEASGLADLILFDVKHADSAKHHEGTGVARGLIDANLRGCVGAEATVLPRIPVIPGFNGGTGDAKSFALYLLDAGFSRVQLLPFHQMGDRKYILLGREYAYRGVKPLYPEDLADYQSVFAAYGVDAFF